MLLAAPLYQEGLLRRYVDRLDLSSGEPLKAQYDAICAWYGEVVLDRKFLIHALVSDHISRSDHPCRVIIPAAGMAPLGIQLVNEWDPGKLREIIEFDLTGMPEKQEIYDSLLPDETARLHCRTADLGSTTDLERVVPRVGPGQTDIVVLEGITYYIPGETIAGLLRRFASPDGRNHAIIEYTQPCEDFSAERRTFPRETFRCIREACGLPKVYPYHIHEIEGFVQAAGGCVDRQYSLTDMERGRTGANRYFPEVSDGWKWICDARI